MTAARLKVYLGAIGYGGLAHADFMTSVLALRPACRALGVSLQVDLVGGEALVSRGHAAMMAKFLASEATHLLLTESDRGFAVDRVFELLGSGEAVAAESGLLLVGRDAARRMVDGYPDLKAWLEAASNPGTAQAAMVFDPLIEGDGRYVYDMEAFHRRWLDLSARPV